ncbi:MAG: hypothetical protein ABL962_14760 [Fimbriimonadaceae bacterium]
MIIARMLRCLPTLTMLCLVGLLNSSAYAQSRLVVVNGVRMTDQQVMQLEYFACTHIPNGAYWLHVNSGAWGFMGNRNVQGYFGDQCNLSANAPERQRRESLSERGLLYRPGEILNGR